MKIPGEFTPYSKEDLDRMREWGDMAITVVPSQYLVKRFLATVDGLQGRLNEVHDELGDYRSNHKMVDLRRQLTNKAVECDGLLSMLRTVYDGTRTGQPEGSWPAAVDIPNPTWQRIKALFPDPHTHNWEVQDTTTVHPQPKAGPVKVRVSYRCSCGGAKFKEFELTLEDPNG